MPRFIFLVLGVLWFVQVGAQGIPEFRAADSAMAIKDYDEAILLYTKSIDNRSPYTLTAYYKRAWCFFHLKDYGRTENDLKVIITYAPKTKEFNTVRGDSYWLLARIYSILGQKQKSLDAYRLALTYEQDVRLYSSLAFVAIGMERYKEALKNLNKALKMDKNYAYGYSNRAWLYLKLGKLEAAKEDIEKSIRLDPTNPYAFKHRALIYLEEGKTDFACKDLHMARELGYAEFGDEADANEVYQLIKRNCP